MINVSLRGGEGRGWEGLGGEGLGGIGRGGMGRGGVGRGGGGELKCYRQTDRQTYRTSDEAGPRGAFAPKNVNTTA